MSNVQTFVTWGYLGYTWGIYYRLYFWWIWGDRWNGWTYGYLWDFSAWWLSTASADTVYDVEFSWISGNAYIKIDWTSIYTSSNTYNYSSNYECPLFASNETGNIVKHPWVRIYYAQYYNANWELVRYLVPCYRRADSVIWMYDIVNNTFYTNAGSWTFIKWPDVN